MLVTVPHLQPYPLPCTTVPGVGDLFVFSGYVSVGLVRINHN